MSAVLYQHIQAVLWNLTSFFDVYNTGKMEIISACTVGLIFKGANFSGSQETQKIKYCLVACLSFQQVRNVQVESDSRALLHLL